MCFIKSAKAFVAMPGNEARLSDKYSHGIGSPFLQLAGGCDRLLCQARDNGCVRFNVCQAQNKDASPQSRCIYKIKGKFVAKGGKLSAVGEGAWKLSTIKLQY